MTDGGAVRVEPTVPPVPSDLLAPLLGVAADVLVDLEAAPEGLAADDGFGDELVLAASDDALRRAIDQDASFRRSVSTRFLEDPRAIDALDGWSVEGALDRVREAAAVGTLPVLVSALYASRPTGWGYGLGAACAIDLGGAPAAVATTPDDQGDEIRAALEMAEQAEEGARRAREELAALRERSARAEADLGRARSAADAANARAEQADEAVQRARSAGEDAERRVRSAEHRVREERAEAEARMAGTRRELEEATARITELAAELASFERRLAQADADRATAVDRARAAELEIEETKRGRLPAHERIALADAASLARRLSARLDELTPPEVAPTRAAPVVAGPTATDRPAAPRAAAPVGPRPAPRIPVGMRADTAEGIDAILRTPRLVVVVDASPAARDAWPDEPVSEQRKHLVASLRALHARYRCDLVAVFLGDDLEPPAKLGRPGVRAVLTEPGEAVEALLLREVAAVPASVPVLVISSDGHVPAEVGRLGATTVAVEPFLAALSA
ncbi:MAG: hypothetical protein ACKO72_01185 [Actinomycetes bacterium]